MQYRLSLCLATVLPLLAAASPQVLPLADDAWQFRNATENTAWLPAVVPGCVHLDLRRHDKIPDPFWGTNELDLQWIEEREWEYQRTFDVTAAMLAEEVVELVADGLDTVATVTVNGKEVARTKNMFIGYRWDVKSLLRPGKNEIHIHFGTSLEYIRTHDVDHFPKEFNDPVGRCAVIRKEQCQFGWDWGPRFVSAGIWRDIRLEAWSTNRLASTRIVQSHQQNASGAPEVILNVTPEFARANAPQSFNVSLAHNGKIVVEKQVSGAAAVDLVVPNPQLWWPAGHGAQPLYTLEVTALGKDGRPSDRWSRRIGLRTIKLDRHPDQWGESFQFVVNGRPLFSKGANWIPAHSFVANLTRADYARDLNAAVAANMNTIRVWGGGIYESEDFYDLCDELGLLVWQDYMFACSTYPGSEEFLATVREEAEYQTRRLRHRASLALWCGNNEIATINGGEILKNPKLHAAYETLFHNLLPEVVTQVDGITDYWPSSPWRYTLEGDRKNEISTTLGDMHYWAVWHQREPVKNYEKWPFRFASEFGMQSYSSPATQATFCPPNDSNVFGPVMENHQKNRAGNQIILDYVSRRYRFPAGQDALIYLSQLNQAYCMETAVEFYRRNSPRCMGALYWQLNDCWPVASWSSIEFTGRWKALHHAARRFFAPALVSADVPGDETPTIGNYRKTTVSTVNLYTVYDAPAPASGLLRWNLFHLDGRILESGRKEVSLRYGESVLQQPLDLAAAMKTHGRDNLYLRIALDIDGSCVSQKTVFLTPPRFLNLAKAETSVAVESISPTKAKLVFTSPVFQHGFVFDLPGTTLSTSDNYFDLYPNEEKVVEVEFDRPVSAADLKAGLKLQSLVNSYE